MEVSCLKYKVLIILLVLSMFFTGCTKKAVSNEPVEPIAVYTKDMVEDQVKDFDTFTLMLVPKLLQNSPLTASFKFDDLESLGLSQLNYHLDDLSEEQLAKSIEDAKYVLNYLSTINYELLSEQQKNTYDLLLYQNQMIVESEPFTYYEALIEPSSGIQTNILLTLVQLDLEDEADVEAYLSRISELPRLIDQVIDFETKRAQSGLLLPASLYDSVLEQMDSIITEPEDFILYTYFCDELISLEASNINTDNAKQRCLTIVKDKILPAYAKLYESVNNLKQYAPQTIGVYAYSNGKEYYNYLVRKETSYNLTGDQLSEWASNQIVSITNQIKDLYQKEPVLQTTSLANSLPSYDDMADLYAIAQQCLNDLFYDYSVEPATDYVIPSYLESYVAAGFYFPVTIDGNSFGNMYLQEASYDNPTVSTLELIFHEDIPGHHLYFTQFYQSDAPLIRKLSSWLPYQEGWAQYIQTACIDYFGLSPSEAQLLKLVNGLTNYYMLKIDIGVHYEGMSQETALSVLTQLGYSEESSKKVLNRIIANPGEVIHYIFGAYKIESYRNLCQEQLGPYFDIRAFHDFILSHGELPFTTMDKLIVEYIKECQLQI